MNRNPKQQLRIKPVDADCKNIDVPIEMHNNLYHIACKRTGYIRQVMLYGSYTINQILALAYIQGMTDGAEAIYRDETLEAMK